MLVLTAPSLNQSYIYVSVGGGGFTLLFTDATSSEPFDFVVSNNWVFFSNGNTTGKFDGTNVRNWGITGPAAAPAISNTGAGNVPGVIGHTYVFTFGSSATAHVSNISPTSTVTSATNRQWTVTGARSTDPQVDQIHVYRTEDGGQIFYELDNSPIANPGVGTWSIVDNDFDGSQLSTPRLQSQLAPLINVNLPPPALKSLEFFAGRIWGIKNNRVYFSGYEEVTNGVPEESWGTQLTNSQAFGGETIGLKALGGADTGALLVFLSDHVYYFSGSSLATFRIGMLSQKRGCRNRATIAAGESEELGPFVTWLDTSSTVRLISITTGIRDISFDIRTDITGIDHTQASLTIHESGTFRWVVLCDGGAGVLRTFDLDRSAWMPPWPVTGATTVYSGETGIGRFDLLLGRNNGSLVKPLSLDRTNTVFQDDSNPYPAYLVMQLMSLVPEDRPEEVGMLEFIGVEHDSSKLQDCSYLLDEDPTVGTPTYTSIFANQQVPHIRATADYPSKSTHTSGVNLKEDWFYLRDQMGSRRAAARIDYPTTNTPFRLHSWAIVSSRQGKS
jgi:hypothetical protein